MRLPMKKGKYFWVCLFFLWSLTSCTSGGDNSSSNSDSSTDSDSIGSYSIGGIISGLIGSVVLQNNQKDDLTLTRNGQFSFATSLETGSSFDVTVDTQPQGQTCSIAKGSGTVENIDVSSVQIICRSNAFEVGGTVSGLSGSLTIQLNEGDDLTISEEGRFLFSLTLMSGVEYIVSISSQPPTQTCSLENASGTIGNVNVSNVAITCTEKQYTIGGQISGLLGNLVLQLNGGSDLSVDTDGSFIFSSSLATAKNYTVSVLSQPTGQNCSLSNATGTIGSSNITNITATCITEKYSLGGTISGLVGSITLKNNGGDDLTLTQDGSFIFATFVDYKTAYLVSISNYPTEQVCYTVNGKGTLGAQNVTDIEITCYAPEEDIFGKLKRSDYYMIYYKAVNDSLIQMARTYPVVILHPFNAQITRQEVQDIQRGVDPQDPSDDVIVIGYISIGEDSRTASLTDEEMKNDALYVDDGTGPAVDPRGPDADGTSLGNINPLGMATNRGYAAWYLDDNSWDQDGTGDGLPDRNAYFGGAFVNAGHPKWFDVINEMTFAKDGFPGLQEILTTETGRGLGFDGVFLDTLDTAAPNSYTDASSDNQGEFEWTAPGFTEFIRKIRQNYAKKLILQNRGLFYYDPRLPQFALSPRSNVDILLFESIRLNSHETEGYSEYFFPDNLYNVTPKLMAEASRPDGFKVFSLGYAAGPEIDIETLTGASNLGFDSLVEDIRVTHSVGMRHYLTDANITNVNDFTKKNASFMDVEVPSWTSVYNANSVWPTPPSAPTPRVGIQKATAQNQSVTVHWDIALDLHPVDYYLYYQTIPFDFSNDTNLTSATKIALTPEIGDQYGSDLQTTYPYKATLSNLTAWQQYYFVIRAVDTSSNGNEEKNQVVLQTTPYGPKTITIDGSYSDWSNLSSLLLDGDDVADSAGPDWLDIKIINDADNLYLYYKSANSFNLDGSPTYGYSRGMFFMDIDESTDTGYGYYNLGSDLLVQGIGLFRQAAGAFEGTFLENITIDSTSDIIEAELSIPLATIRNEYPMVTKIRFIFLNDEMVDLAPDSGYLEYSLISTE